MQELCLTLLLFAAQVGEFQNPGVCPKVHRVSQQVLQAQACAGAACPVQAFYAYAEQHIFLDESLDLDDIPGRGIFLHELVHYLQDLNGQLQDRSCIATLHRELQAFRIQERYLLTEQRWQPVGMNLMGYRCAY